MLETRMVIPCTVYTQTVDEYNDIRLTNGTNTKCWFRDGRTLTSAQFQEGEGSDAMAWFPPGTVISDGDLVTVEGKTYRVNHVINARRLGSTTIQFIKTWLNRYDGGVS